MSTVANSTSTSRLTSTNIILLQNLIKRDPDSYREEFLQQLNHYATIRDIFLLSEQTNSGSSEQQQQLDLLNDDDEQLMSTPTLVPKTLTIKLLLILLN